jgi:hypothetical protein
MKKANKHQGAMLLAVAGFLMLSAGYVMGHPEVIISKIADTKTPNPSDPQQTFTRLQLPDIDHGKVVFMNWIDNWHSGVYLFDSGKLEIVADWNTPIPGAPQFQFMRFSGPSLDGGQVAFWGQYPGIPNWVGIYLWRGPGAITRVSDIETIIPGTADSFDTGIFDNCPRLDAGQVVFTGGNSIFADPRVAGVYLYQGSALSTVADTSNVIPGTTDCFVPGYGWDPQHEYDVRDG